MKLVDYSSDSEQEETKTQSLSNPTTAHEAPPADPKEHGQNDFLPKSDDEAREMIRRLTPPDPKYTSHFRNAHQPTFESARIYQLAQLKSPRHRGNKPLVHIHTRMAATQLDMLRPGWVDEQLDSYNLHFYPDSSAFSTALPQASQLPTIQQLQLQARQKPRTRIEFESKKN